MTSPHPFHERPRPGSDTEPGKLPQLIFHPVPAE